MDLSTKTPAVNVEVTLRPKVWTLARYIVLIRQYISRMLSYVIMRSSRRSRENSPPRVIVVQLQRRPRLSSKCCLWRGLRSPINLNSARFVAVLHPILNYSWSRCRVRREPRAQTRDYIRPLILLTTLVFTHSRNSGIN